ncbi:MAG: hypothetical protein FWF02_14835 [Micrococcales bacterium]|nr:hypothetical protein [Micrococcales bacterium]MCL2668954.1 hypothetical protein [Micrococcales bacterium]
MKTYLPVEPGRVATLDNSRPTFVVDRLDDLSGPTQGVVTLPLVLDWTPANTYDLSCEPRVRRLYETVLSEALSEDDVQTYVDKTTLVRLWRRLRLPPRVRVAWESVHPELAG